MKEVKQWAPHADGRRIAFFDACDGVLVKVEPAAGAENADAFNVACDLADHASALAKRDDEIAKWRRHAEHLAREITVLRGQMPPAAPVHLLGTGYVRFCDGRPWIMSRRERGLAEFGVRCESWDDLFRRYDVRVTEHGTDEHGPWWAVENMVAR